MSGLPVLALARLRPGPPQNSGERARPRPHRAPELAGPLTRTQLQYSHSSHFALLLKGRPGPRPGQRKTHHQNTTELFPLKPGCTAAEGAGYSSPGQLNAWPQLLTKHVSF